MVGFSSQHPYSIVLNCLYIELQGICCPPLVSSSSCIHLHIISLKYIEFVIITTITIIIILNYLGRKEVILWCNRVDCTLIEFHFSLESLCVNLLTYS